MLRVLRQNVVLGDLHLQLDKKGKAIKWRQSLSSRKMKPKLIGLPVSETYRLGLLEDETNHTWSPS